MLQVITIPVLDDNYSYLVIDTETREAGVVDPAEPSKVLKVLEQENVQLTTILTTHKHWDHAGGNIEILSTYKNLKVYGGEEDDVAGGTDIARPDTIIRSIGNLQIQVLHTPCHTRGHVMYYIEEETQSILFTGDMLFSGSCGKFFEGTAAEMHHALNVQLRAYADSVLVYCGHEYTASNLTFARTVEPDNPHLSDYWARISKQQRETNTVVRTTPSTLGLERRINPFMRVEEESVRVYTGKTDPVEVMQELRRRKNEFKPKTSTT